MLIQKKNGIRLSGGAIKALLFLSAVVLCGFLSGILNGFLGTGGGILLLPLLSRAAGAGNKRDAFAAALFCMVPLSVLSLGLSLFGGAADSASLPRSIVIPLCCGGIAGGVFGAWLLSRISVPLLSLLFSALLVFSGVRMVFA